MKNLKLFIPFFVFIGLALFLLKGLDRDPNALPSALIGKPVPAFSLPDIHRPDTSVDESIFKARVTLLNVWATWCAACRIEHPFLMELAREQNVRLVSVNYKDQRPAALRWLEERGDPYEITFEDAAGDFGLDLGVFGAPETYLVDSNGIIRARHVGVLDESGWAELKPQYEALLAQAQQGVAQ